MSDSDGVGTRDPPLDFRVLVGEFERCGAEPLHADHRDEAVRQAPLHGGVGLEIFEFAHSELAVMGMTESSSTAKLCKGFANKLPSWQSTSRSLQNVGQRCTFAQAIPLTPRDTHMPQNHRLCLQIEVMTFRLDLHRPANRLFEALPVAGMSAQYLAQIHRMLLPQA